MRVTSETTEIFQPQITRMSTEDGRTEATGPVIEALGAEVSALDRAELGALLRACVEGGASIGFLAPLPRE
jgi:hypothetical protein